jgi:hypothetical protein
MDILGIGTDILAPHRKQKGWATRTSPNTGGIPMCLLNSWHRIYISTKKIVVYFAEGLSLTFLQITVKYTDDKFLTRPFWIVFSDAKIFSHLWYWKKLYNMFITSIIQSAAFLQYALLTWMKGIHNYLLVPDW